MLKKEIITYLIVHCSDTCDTEDLRATDIHNMHLGFGWDGAGYHHIICRDGQIELADRLTGKVHMSMAKTKIVWEFV